MHWPWGQKVSGQGHAVKLAFHDADTDIVAEILARIVARMSACRSACHRNNFRKSRVSDVSARILARMSVSVSVSAPWNSSFNLPGRLQNTRVATRRWALVHGYQSSDDVWPDFRRNFTSSTRSWWAHNSSQHYRKTTHTQYEHAVWPRISAGREASVL